MDKELENNFKKAYESLNAAQQKAVDSIEGPVMVIAGPGTGKTQILTLRIANILKKTDVKPQNILALTFTESGTRAMRERLFSLIGEVAYDVAIFTFHGFADYLIQKYPEAYTEIIGGRPATDIERIQIIETILRDTQFKALRPSGDPAFYVKPIRDALATLKQEYITPDSFASSIEVQEHTLQSIERYHEKGAHKGKERGEYKEAAKHLERNKELLHVYRLYESMLRSHKLYDFSDMIIKTVEALSLNEEMLLSLQEQYQYVLADEHQDVNGSQNKILELLVHFHEHPNLFVVGDEKQAIYRFQGASLDNFLYFENTFGTTTTISLTDNYRSGQAILDAAHELIKTDDEVLKALRIPLCSARVKDAVVCEATFSHEAIETGWVVDAVKHDIASGIPENEIAIIVRTNREVELFANALRKASIAAAPSADSDILQHPVMVSILKLLRACAAPSDDAHLIRLLHEPYWKLKVSDLCCVLHMSKPARSLSGLLRDRTILDTVLLEDPASVMRVAEVIDDVREKTTTQAPHRLLETLLRDSGFIEHVLEHDPFEGVRIIRRLYDEVEGMVVRKEVSDLTDVLERLELHIKYGVSLSAPFIPQGNKAVQVMTAHKSKGLEFECVYIPHMHDRAWGSKQSRELFKLPIVKHEVGDFDVSEDDERRLFFVALTRAKAKVVCTRALENVEGKELPASRFLLSLEEVSTVLDVEAFSNSFSAVADLVPSLPDPITTDIILQTLTERGFSPTAFNNYLKSPWEYFYRNVLRVPEIKVPELQFGTAVHFVLDELVRIHSVNEDGMSASKISELLKYALSRESLSDEEYARLHERGLEALVSYSEHMRSQISRESKTEVHLEGVLETGIAEYPLLKLNGTLDRVDYEDGVIVRVVDYKTGRPKTRGEIEGSTQSSDGAYKRQLVFYALLLSLQSDSAMHCKKGVLSFIERDKSGAFKEEEFMVTNTEIAALKEELIAVTKEIVNGDALLAPCDPLVCHYCDLVPFWQQRG